jgi:hypothetical protein
LRKRRAAGFESPIKPCLIFPGHIAGGRGLAVKTPVCETGNVSSNLAAHPKSFAGGVVKGYFHLIRRAGRKPAKEWKPWGRGRSPEPQGTRGESALMTDPGRLFPGEYFFEKSPRRISRGFGGAISALLGKEVKSWASM